MACAQAPNTFALGDSKVTDGGELLWAGSRPATFVIFEFSLCFGHEMEHLLCKLVGNWRKKSINCWTLWTPHKVIGNTKFHSLKFPSNRSATAGFRRELMGRPDVCICFQSGREQVAISENPYSPLCSFLWKADVSPTKWAQLSGKWLEMCGFWVSLITSMHARDSEGTLNHTEWDSRNGVRKVHSLEVFHGPLFQVITLDRRREAMSSQGGKQLSRLSVMLTNDKVQGVFIWIESAELPVGSERLKTYACLRP